MSARIGRLKTARYSGATEDQATSRDIDYATARAFVVRYFKVKGTIPDEILREAVKQRMGRSMSYRKFRGFIKRDRKKAQNK